MTWCTTYEISRDEIDMFLTLIRQMDDVFIEIANNGELRGSQKPADLGTLDSIFG